MHFDGMLCLVGHRASGVLERIILPFGFRTVNHTQLAADTGMGNRIGLELWGRHRRRITFSVYGAAS